jgi:8-oxo-dGTP pyrophosphatase MutT (NUDIX family)
VIFVRHTYGNRSSWELPGGGAHRGETPAAAARREAREELGRDIAGWMHLATARGSWHGKSESLECFGARWPGGPVRYDRVEIGAVGWFALDDPPSPVGPSTRVALEGLRTGA